MRSAFLYFCVFVALTSVDSARAEVVFNNGGVYQDSFHCNGNYCGGSSGSWKIFDSFTLDNSTTITGFSSWNANGHNAAANPALYTSTNWSIWTNDPRFGGAAIASGNSVAALSYDAGVFGNVYLRTDVSGLAINLAAGEYWLGIHQNTQYSAGESWTYVSTVSGWPDASQWVDNSFVVGSMAGEALTISAVPEAQTYALMIIGLVLVSGMARSRRSIEVPDRG